MKRNLFLLILISSIVLFSCKSKKNTTKNHISINQATWELEVINGELIDTLNFSQGYPTLKLDTASNEFSGFSGCNNYNGEFILNEEEGTLSFGPINATKKACQNVDETLFFNTLRGITVFSYENEYLILKDNEIDILKFKKQ